MRITSPNGRSSRRRGKSASPSSPSGRRMSTKAMSKPVRSAMSSAPLAPRENTTSSSADNSTRSSATFSASSALSSTTRTRRLMAPDEPRPTRSARPATRLEEHVLQLVADRRHARVVDIRGHQRETCRRQHRAKPNHEFDAARVREPQVDERDLVFRGPGQLERLCRRSARIGRTPSVSRSSATFSASARLSSTIKTFTGPPPRPYRAPPRGA